MSKKKRFLVRIHSPWAAHADENGKMTGYASEYWMTAGEIRQLENRRFTMEDFIILKGKK